LSLPIILSSFLTQRAYGTITNEYEHSQFDDFGRLLFRFKVNVVIETELDGTWIFGRLYRIDFIITLNYINETRIKGVAVEFYDPGFVGLGVGEYKGGYIVYSTRLFLDRMGALSFKTGYIDSARHLLTYPRISYNYTEIRLGEEFFHSKSWDGIGPIYINMKESPDVLQPFSVAIIGIAIGVVIGMGSVLLGIKIGEKRAEKKKVNP
jgi:hypothetical protein